MDKIRIGIIGLGFMGTTHFGIYQSLDHATVTAVSDTDPAKRSGDISAVAGNIGDGAGSHLDMTGITAFDDPYKMIESDLIDVVDICVPTPFHCDYAIAALQAGKHVFCEKPICRNLQQLGRLEAALAARKPGQQFNVGMCVRAWPEYDDAVKRIRNGELGKIHSASLRRISPSVVGNGWQNWYLHDEISGGALLDMHLHDTDFICYLFGKPKSVTSWGVRGIISDNGVDHVLTRYHYDDDKIITAEGAWAMSKGFQFEMSFIINGEKGTLQLDPQGYRAYWNDQRGTQELAPENQGLPTGWHQELAYFVECICQGKDADRWQTPQSVIDAWKVAMAEIASVDSGRTMEIQ